MAGRTDERGYAQSDDSRQREPYAGQDFGEDPRASGRYMRRPDREFDRGRFADAQADEHQPGKYGDGQRSDQQLPLRVTSSLSHALVAALERGASILGGNIRMYQDETMRFMTERLEHGTATLEQMGRSRSVFDLFAIQQQWLNATTRAYSDEWMRLSKLTGDAAQPGASEVRSAAVDSRRAAYDAE